jgi:hypothetical protein
MTDPVLLHGEDPTFDLWPATLAACVSWADPDDGVIVLDGDTTPEEVGTVVAMWCDVRHDEGDGEVLRSVWTAEEYVRRALGTRVPGDVTDGGLRLRDGESGVTILPGCCCGLEDWRYWLDVLDGGRPVLGHGPRPHVEHDGPVVRMWPDDQDRTGPHLVLPLADLPGVLVSVRRRMVDFLALVERWAEHRVPALAHALVSEMDASLRIREPLPW